MGWREREDQRRHQIAELADTLHEVDVGEVAERLGTWLRSAEAAGQHIGLGVTQLLTELGKHGAPTDLLLEVLAAEELRQHAYALAATALEREPDRWRDWVPAALGEPQGRGMAITVVLTAPTSPDEAIDYTLYELNSTDTWLLEQILHRRGEADAVVKALLAHSDPTIRATTAIEFRVGDMAHGLDLPDDWYDEWCGAFLEVAADLSGHTNWRFQELAKALAGVDPDLLTEWLVRTLEDRRRLPSHDTIELVGQLPRDQRRSVLDAADGHPTRRWLICAALGTDPEFAPELLDENVIDVDDVTICIERDHRGTWFETIAPELVRRGADPQAVATHLQFGAGWGHMSDFYTTLANYLDELADSDISELAEVGRVGAAAFQEAAAQATRQERQDRIRGL